MLGYRLCRLQENVGIELIWKFGYDGQVEIFHITRTRATIMQKYTKHVKYARCFPIGNFPLFAAGTNRTVK